MVKLKRGKFNADKSVRKNGISNVLNGKVKKLKKKIVNVSANSAVGKFIADKGVRKNEVSNVLNGKVEKFKKKFVNVSANSAVGKFIADKGVRKNEVSNVLNGKVEKFKKKFVNVSASSDSNVHQKTRLELVKSDHDNKPVQRRAINKNLKRLKKKFGSTLHSGGSVMDKSVADGAAKRKLNEKPEKGGAKKFKKKKKKEIEETESKDENIIEVPLTRSSDKPIPKKLSWVNRQRVLIFACRGIGTRDRHLMKDLRRLMPHARPENKLERRENLSVVNEICTMKHCNKCILFEGRANRDVYMWLSNIPNGPSVKFLLQNIYTMDELKFTGNCLIGSRPLLSFDENFEKILHYRLLKELLTQIFGTPKSHPKSQPFFDHVFTFSVLDKRIWFRNYQILSEDGAVVEIGPRFVMNPVKIFDRSFGGQTIWENPHYVTPAKNRQLVRKLASGKYVNKKQQKEEYDAKQGGISYKLPDTDEVFTANPFKTAQELITRNSKVQESSKLKSKKKNKPRDLQKAISNPGVQQSSKVKSKKKKNNSKKLKKSPPT